MIVSLAVGAPQASTLHAIARTDAALARITERLATGLRVNRAADAPADLIASEHLAAHLAVLEAESRQIDRADAVARTADGAIAEVSALLARAEELAAANAGSSTLSDAERQANQVELDAVIASIDRVARTTAFNGSRLLDGSASLSAAGQSIQIPSMLARDLGLITSDDGSSHALADGAAGGSLSTPEMSHELLRSIRGAIEQVGRAAGKLGGFQRNTLEPARRAGHAAIENLAAARSSIRDLDYAWGVAELARAGTLRATALALAARPSDPAPGRSIFLNA